MLKWLSRLESYKVQFIRLNAEYRQLAAQLDNLKQKHEDIVKMLLHRQELDRKNIDNLLDMVRDRAEKYWALKAKYEPEDLERESNEGLASDLSKMRDTSDSWTEPKGPDHG